MKTGRKKKTGSLAHELATLILKKDSEIKYLTFEDTDEIYWYKNGIYVKNGEALIRSITELTLKEKANNTIVNEVLGKIRRNTYTKREVFEKTSTELLCLENGILNIQTRELQPHTPEIFFLQKIPVKFDPTAKAPITQKFLSEILPDDEKKAILEIAGYCLQRDYRHQKAFMLVGGGRNGKSSFLGLVRALLGTENVSSCSLQDLCLNRFAKSDLYGKLANIFNDLPAKHVSDDTTFKMLTGGDIIRGEQKFRTAFGFVNFAKLIFATNRAPKMPEDNDAVWRRWYVLNFPMQFDEKNADKTILSKITTSEELSGFLNLCIDGLHQLNANNVFTGSENIEITREKYIRISDSVASFVLDCIEVDPNGWIEKKRLFETYSDYCRQKNLSILTEAVFHQQLIKSQDIRVEDCRPTVEGLRVHAWKGIRIIERNTLKNPSTLSTQKPSINLTSFLQSRVREGENSLINSDTLGGLGGREAPADPADPPKAAKVAAE